MISGNIDKFIKGFFDMKKAQKKNRKLIRNFLLIGIVAYFVCSAFFGVISRISDYKTEIAAINSRIEAEKEINRSLKEDKLNMHSDENYKKIARKTLGLVEPGDKVYINTNDDK